MWWQFGTKAEHWEVLISVIRRQNLSHRCQRAQILVRAPLDGVFSVSFVVQCFNENWKNPVNTAQQTLTTTLSLQINESTPFGRCSAETAAAWDCRWTL
jgi:hypothetical protein